MHKVFGWAGEPRHEQPSRNDYDDQIDNGTLTFWQGQPFVPNANTTEPIAITCRDGEVDVIIVQVMLDGKPDIVEKHVGGDGVIDWNGVAGENRAAHDHWPNGFGVVAITGFNGDEGDRLIVTGHTVTNGEAIDATDDDQYGDLPAGAVRRIYSQQGGGGGAHDEDTLGYLVFTDRGDAPEATTIHSNVGICRTFAEFKAIVATYQDIEAAYWEVNDPATVDDLKPDDADPDDWERFTGMLERHGMDYLTDDELLELFDRFFGDAE